MSSYLLLPREEVFTFSLYAYKPNLIAAIIAAFLFLLGACIHYIQAGKLKANYFIPFVVGCLMEAVGYGGRIWSHFDPTGLPGYIIQSLLILIAPALFAASIYMVLGRIIALVDGDKHSLIPLKFLTKVFVVGDCISFFVQAGGGGIQSAGTLELLHLGEKMIIVGLFIQILFFGIFIVSAVVFHIRISRSPTRLSTSAEIPWRSHLTVLYLTSGIILVRSVFRVVEYCMGSQGYILQHEWMLYIFDACLMMSVVVIFYFQHPGKLFSAAAKSEDIEFARLESS